MYATDHIHAMTETTLDDGRLTEIWRGHDGGFEACNTLHFYHAPNPTDDLAGQAIDRVLEPVHAYNLANPQAKLSVVIGGLYDLFVESTRDTSKQWVNHEFSEAERESLVTYITALCEWEQGDSSRAGTIAGWYMADEPEWHGVDIADYYRLVDLVRETEMAVTGANGHKMYVALLAEKFWQMGDSAASCTKHRWVNSDGTLFCTEETPDIPDGVVATVTDPNAIVYDDGVTTTRYPSSTGAYEHKWFYTMWEADVIILNSYRDELEFWGRIMGPARHDVTHHGSSRPWGEGEWGVHAGVIALRGYRFDKYSDEGDLFGNPPSYPGHADMHSAIRHVRDLGAEGLWFYGWIHDCVNYENCRCLGTAEEYWLHLSAAESWAEAAETEIEHRDMLIVGGSTPDVNQNVMTQFGLDAYDGSSTVDLGTSTLLSWGGFYRSRFSIVHWGLRWRWRR